MSAQFEVIQNRLTEYADLLEHWQADHARAMQCLDLELVLQSGLSVLQALHWIDENYRIRFLGTPEFDPKFEEWMEGAFAQWLAPHAEILQKLEDFEREFTVEHAEAFRAAVREVTSLLTPDAEFFQGDALTELRDAAVEAHRQGKTFPLLK